MEPLKFDSYFLKKSAAEKKRCFTKEQVLADEIWNYFGKKLPFARIMKIIKTNGHQKVYESWNEVRQSDFQNPLSLFIWKTSKHDPTRSTRKD